MPEMSHNKMGINTGIQYMPYETPLVQFVDKIIDERIKIGRPVEIKRDADWNLVEFILRGFDALYPEYSNQFFKHMADIRAKANHLGVSREGEAMIQHQIEIPQALYSMIMTAFPKQKWSTQFNVKFARHFTNFKGADHI